MTKWRRRLLIGFLATFVVLGALTLPPVHWGLTGWWRGEPFFRGMPASYYAAQISRMWGGARSPIETSARKHVSDGVADVFWGAPETWKGMFGMLTDPASLDALPVLIALAENADPQVRGLSVSCLSKLNEGAAPAVPV